MQATHDGSSSSYETWFVALISSACIGFTSLVPWLFNMTFFEHRKLVKGSPKEDWRMKCLLSFAVGAILGNIFFHLIPESFQSHVSELDDSDRDASKKVGLSLIGGIFMFIIVQIFLEGWSPPVNEARESQQILNNVDTQSYCLGGQTKVDNHISFSKSDISIKHDLFFNEESIRETNNNVALDDSTKAYSGVLDSQIVYRKRIFIENNNGDTLDKNLTAEKTFNFLDKSEAASLDSSNTGDQIGSTDSHPAVLTSNQGKDASQIVDVAGYLSLIANGFDNFIHGLAIGASFLVGSKLGLLTTFSIFIHEIPHEICDYAILVNSGFSRWGAVKAQSSVSLFGLLGTATALYVKSIETLKAKTIWILPFSAGGFLYIALVSLLPKILDREAAILDSIIQVICVALGVAFMASVAII